ncbi:hypothetical protein Tco_1281157, partial [Tanacetum coccineum]
VVRRFVDGCGSWMLNYVIDNMQQHTKGYVIVITLPVPMRLAQRKSRSSPEDFSKSVSNRDESFYEESFRYAQHLARAGLESSNLEWTGYTLFLFPINDLLLFVAETKLESFLLVLREESPGPLKA